MIHSKSLKTMLAVATIVGVAFAAPNKNEMSNEIVPVGGHVSKNGDTVSASWGGFQASASLADDGTAAASAGGNGLGAGAGYGAGGAGAGAGVYGTGASAGSASSVYSSGAYGNGGKPGSANAGAGNGGGFFDRIFAIPINVLQSVNTYLNQKQQGQAGAAAQGHPARPGANADRVPEASVGADYGQGGASAGAATGSGAYAEAGAKVGHGKNGDPMMVHKNTNYNDIFNIPITALRSVQNLLNG